MSRNLEIISLELLEAMTQTDPIWGMREKVEEVKKGGKAPLFVIWQRTSHKEERYKSKVLHSGLTADQVLESGIQVLNPDISIQMQGEPNKFWFADFPTAYKVFQHKVLFHFGAKLEVYNDGKISNKYHEIKLSHERNQFFNYGKISAVVSVKTPNSHDFNHFVHSYQESKMFFDEADEYLRNN